jgi:hypothetical protein
MDWTSFNNAPSRWRPYVMKINNFLVGNSDNFCTDIYRREDTCEKVRTFLNSASSRNGELSLSSKKSYLAALSTYLQIAGIDSKPYKELISKLAQQIRLSPVEASTDCSVTAQDLDYAIKSIKVNYHIKLMCAILLYGYHKKLRLVDVCATRHDTDNGNEHYLDTVTGLWTLYNRSNALPVKIKICQELLDVINNGKGTMWVTGNKISATNSISMLFKHMFKHSYLSVAKALHPGDSDTSDNDETTKESVEEVAVAETVNVDEAETVTETRATDKVKITIKVKPSANVRSTQYEWSYFRREKADDIHIQRLQQLMDMITTDHEYFYHSLIDTVNGASIVEEKLKGIKSINTQVNYCNSLCKFLELTMARHYSDFTLLRDKLNLVLHQHNATRSVIPYDEIVPRLQNVLTSSRASKDLKIMAMLLISIKDYEIMNTGALRLSDVMNTRLIDDGEHHYLDLESKSWLLRDGYTKNKQTRSAVISDSFKEYIENLEINTDDVPLICSSGKTTNLSKEFQKYVGINFSSVRASYVTYLDSVCDNVETIKKICNNQGHKLATALESYRRLGDAATEDE